MPAISRTSRAHEEDDGLRKDGPTTSESNAEAESFCL